MSPRILFAAAVAAFSTFASIASAGVVYVEQERRVESAVGHNSEEFFGGREEVAPDFGPFDGRAESDDFDPDDGDNVRAIMTQLSRLETAGVAANGVLRVEGDDDFGRGSSRLRTIFDVTDSPQDFTLRYDIQATGDTFPTAVRRAFNAMLSLRRIDGTGTGTDVATPLDVDLFYEEGEGPTAASDTESGTLAPGRYALDFLIEAFPSNPFANYQATYDVALQLSEAGPGPTPIPLPPAALAALVTTGAFGALKAARSRRLTRCSASR